MFESEIEELYLKFELLKQDLMKAITKNHSLPLVRTTKLIQKLRKDYNDYINVFSILNEKDTAYLYKLQGKRNKFDLVGDIIYVYYIVSYINARGRGYLQRGQKCARWQVIDLRTYKFTTRTTRCLRAYFDEAKSIIGLESGKLIVIEGPKYEKSGRIKWLCRCKCGKEVYKNDSVLRHKMAKDCGPYCTLNPKNRERALKTYENQVKKTSMSGNYFKKEYKRILQGRNTPKSLINQVLDDGFKRKLKRNGG